VVITQGSDPTIVVANGKVLEFRVIPVRGLSLISQI